MNNRDNILKERLKYQENWVNYYQWYFAHSDISEKVSEELNVLNEQLGRIDLEKKTYKDLTPRLKNKKERLEEEIKTE